MLAEEALIAAFELLETVGVLETRDGPLDE